MKIRVLHTAALLKPPSGILNQMQWECDAARALGASWIVQMYCPSNSAGVNEIGFFDEKIDAKSLSNAVGRLKAWVILRYRYHQWLLRSQNDVDVFLLRYYVHDPFQLIFLLRCKKPVYFVHHTLEVPELKLSGNLSSRIRSLLESVVGRYSIGRVDGIIGVTPEIVNYERSRTKAKLRSCIYPNGIVYSDSKISDKRSFKIPELLFVANFAPWHGLDLLLEALKRNSSPLILHLVGKIPSSLSEQLGDRRIKVHGELNSTQISTLSQSCWVGLSSFALDRNNMTQACPLKVREYLLLGLPVYGSYTDTFPPSVEYFKNGAPDFDQIINFAQESRNFSKTQIRELAREFIDKKSLLAKLINWIDRPEILIKRK